MIDKQLMNESLEDYQAHRNIADGLARDEELTKKIAVGFIIWVAILVSLSALWIAHYFSVAALGYVAIGIIIIAAGYFARKAWSWVVATWRSR